MNDSAVPASSPKNTTRKNTKTNMEYSSFIQEVKESLDSNPGSYRFLYTEPKSLDSQYLFIGLNPGGVETDPSDLFIKSGNAILNENWAGTTKNPLQNQIMYFFEDIARQLASVEDWIPYMNTKWMISNYVFYRSPNWKEMASKKSHIQTCKSIWRKIFLNKVPKIIVANGYETHQYMIDLLEELGWKKITETRSCGAWIGPHIITMELNGHKCITVGFAHLSRFPIIRREKNKECLSQLYTMLKEYA